MALISAGVEVSVRDESFYVPAASPTVPLFIVATAENKTQPNGTSPALGTYEHNRVRTVTSLGQSVQLYGIPRFLQTTSGEDRHGDSRNEYGVLALNQYLGVGSRAYVVRANVNLDDDRATILSMWLSKIGSVALDIEVGAAEYIEQYNLANNYMLGNPAYKTTLTKAEFLTLSKDALSSVYSSYNFKSTLFKTDFESDKRATPLDVYDNTFATVVGEFVGLTGAAEDWATNLSGSTVGKQAEFTPVEASTLVLDLADDFAFTIEFLSSTSLGANDTARRVAIVTALQESLAQPQLRSEQYEYNIIVCPGFYETVDDMIALAVDVKSEAIVIGDTPMNLDADAVAEWAVDPSNGRQFNNLVTYYYGHGLTTNMNGRDVLGAASGIALRTMAMSDRNFDVWYAVAGTQRGTVTGVSQIGYFSGVAGEATKFVEAVMNQGQRDALYRDGANINPITFIPGRGILIMGQKTSANVTSALDRLNVVRLLCHIRRNLRKSTFAFLFEPNDQHTRDNVRAMVDNFLKDIMFKRGLYDFLVVCDESNNSSSAIDRSELHVDIAVKPTRAIEFIYIPIRVLSTGAEL